jgi:hypothetical protein
MKKNSIFFFVLLSLVVGSVGIYAYVQKSKQPVITQGSASFPELKKEELIQQSDTIVVGQVQNLNSVKVPSEIRKGEEDIITNVTLKVEKYLRNYSDTSSQEITVQTLGGTIGNSTMDIEGAASFTQGEHVIVFLKKKNIDVFTIYGWAQGKYSIDTQGKVGVGEQELSYFRNIFGLNLDLVELEGQIALFKDVAPKEETSSFNNSLENKNVDADARNAEANSVLRGSTSQ